MTTPISNKIIPEATEAKAQPAEVLEEPSNVEVSIQCSLSEDPQSTNEVEGKNSAEEEGVKRDLKQRHIAMIALGGTIGTGLFIGIAQPLMNSGPVGSLIAYLFMGTVIFSVTQSLGEMVTLIPVTSSFTVFSTRFLSPAFGAANGYMYWFSWAVTFAVELSVVGQVIFFWTEKVPLAAWISIFWVILTLFNMFPVRYYGEIEFWIAFTKVISIIGFIIFCVCMVCGAGPYGPFGFRYWKNPGPWGPGIISSNKHEARFLGWFSSLINAAFTFQGTELVGITAGEAANPRKTVPKAIKKVVLRIFIFYILSLFLIGLLVPYNDPKLTSTTTYVSQSPFIIAIQNAGVAILPGIFNGVILITIISAGNSNVYVGSRILYGLARDGSAPKLFRKTTKYGVPYVAVIVTSLFGSLAYLELSVGGVQAFQWLLNIVSIAGFFAWLLISLAHVRFMKTLQYRGISRSDLPFKAILMPWLAYYAIFFIVIIIIFQGFTAFTPHFDKVQFIASYISLFLFILIWLVFQIWKRCRLFWKVQEIDIDTDRKDIDDMVWEDEDPQGYLQKFWMFVS